MNKMKIINTVVDVVLILMVIDAAIVLYSLFVVGMGGEVIDIPFWTMQMAFVANLLG